MGFLCQLTCSTATPPDDERRAGVADGSRRLDVKLIFCSVRSLLFSRVISKSFLFFINQILNLELFFFQDGVTVAVDSLGSLGRLPSVAAFQHFPSPPDEFT